MWLRVFTNRKVAIYSDGDNIIIIIIIGFLVKSLSLFCWYYFGCVGITLVALVFRW